MLTDDVQHLHKIMERRKTTCPHQSLTLHNSWCSHDNDAATITVLVAAYPELFSVKALPTGSHAGRLSAYPKNRAAR